MSEYVPEERQDSDTLLKRAAAWEADAHSYARMGFPAKAESRRREAERLFALALQRA